jgi:hypothetical protein
MNTTNYTNNWRAPLSWQTREFEMRRRVTRSTMERQTDTERERGDGIEKDKSGYTRGVDICVVRKYVDLVMARSILSFRRGTNARGGAFSEKGYHG